MVNNEKGCKAATSEPFKQSDVKDFGADAKIIIALLKRQPQKRLELCEKAGINESTFSRYKRLLINRGIVKEDDKGFSLWFHKEQLGLWDDLLRNLQDAGGHLVKLRLEKPRFVSQNPASNNLERIYDPISIKGVIILRGAAKLEAMLRSNVPVLDYFRFLCSSPPVFLATPSSVEKGDRFIWQDKVYEIEEARQFFDGETLSYTLAKTPYSPRS